MIDNVLYTDTFGEIQLWSDELERFFLTDCDDYFETDFSCKITFHDTENLAEDFFRLPEDLRTIAFHHAVLTDDPDVLEVLITAVQNEELNINTDLGDEVFGTSPLMMACYNKCRNSFSALVQKGQADLNVKDKLGRGLAHACLFSHNLPFMKWAQQRGVVFDVNNATDALIPLAGAECSIATLKWLIDDLGGNVNFADNDGHTAMFYACLWEVRDNILYLINKGAYPTELSEAAFAPIVYRIQQLQKQEKSTLVDLEIKREIKKLCDFAKKL